MRNVEEVSISGLGAAPRRADLGKPGPSRADAARDRARNLLPPKGARGPDRGAPGPGPADRPGRQAPGRREQARDALRKLPAGKARQVLAAHHAKQESERKAAFAALRDASAKKGGALPLAERRALGARALALHIRAQRAKIAQLLHAEAERIEGSNPQLAEKLRAAGRAVLALKFRIGPDGAPVPVCPGRGGGSVDGFGYISGGSYSGSEFVPQYPEAFDWRSPDRDIRRALALGGPEALRVLPSPFVIPTFAQLPGVGDAQPWAGMPDHRPQPLVMLPGAPVAPPIAVDGTTLIPAAQQHPVHRELGIPKPASVAEAAAAGGLEGIDGARPGAKARRELRQQAQEAGIRPGRRARKELAEQAKEAKDAEVSDADMGWLGEDLILADVAGLFGEVLTAEDEAGLDIADVNLGSLFDGVARGVEATAGALGKGIRFAGKVLRVPLAMIFPIALHRRAIGIGHRTGGHFIGMIRAILGVAVPAGILAAIAADLRDGEVDVAKQIGAPPAGDAAKARLAAILAELGRAPARNPCG